MFRYLIITCVFAVPAAAGAAEAPWTCNPVWSFSGMGDKPYAGAGDTEAAAQAAARKACVSHNRSLELDDFCVAQPKGNAWNCAQTGPGSSAPPSR